MNTYKVMTTKTVFKRLYFCLGLNEDTMFENTIMCPVFINTNSVVYYVCVVVCLDL